jgi:hypothetical protein
MLADGRVPGSRRNEVRLVERRTTDGEAVSSADLDLGEWSAEQGTDFEAAEWVLGALIAWCSAESSAVAGAASSAVVQQAELAAERERYAALQRELSVHNSAHTREVLATYGALARLRYQSLPRCSG